MFQRNWFHILIGMLWLCLQYDHVHGEQILFRNYSVEQGLVSNTVWCINQDQKGYMWFGTRNGLSRFDGYQFKSYQNIPGGETTIANNFIHAIFQYDAETYWLATEGGIAILDLATETFSRLEEIGEQVIFDIVRDENGVMWIASKHNGLYTYNPVTRKLDNFRPVKGKPSLSHLQIRKLVLDGQGNLWIGTFGGGIDVFHTGKRTFRNYHTKNSRLSSDHILTLYQDKQGTIWAGTFAGGLSKWLPDERDFHTYRKSAENNSVNDNIVRVIYQSEPDKLYIGTEKGLNILEYATGKFTYYEHKNNDAYSISDNAVYSIFRDREGGVWLGTYFGGLSYFRGEKSSFEHFYSSGDKGGLQGNAVSCFLEDSPGKFWIGTEDGGLCYYEADKQRFSSYPFRAGQEPLSYHNVHALYKDSRGHIWIGTYSGGLNVLNPQTGKIRRYQHQPGNPSSISNNSVYAIYEDREGVIWVGTIKGLNIYRSETDDFIQVKDMNLNNNCIYDIYEDNTNTIWFATHDAGIFSQHKKTGKWNHYHTGSEEFRLSSNKVICFLDDHAGNIWIGTDGGSLNRINVSRGESQVYDARTGFHGNVVYGLLMDDHRTIWIATNNGLYHYRPKEHSFKQFTVWDNLQSKQFNYKAYCKAADGKLLFGGIKGFNAFYPDSIRYRQFASHVTITNLQLFNKDVQIAEGSSTLNRLISYTDQIVLKHDQTVVSFEYSALSYAAPGQIKYAYKLDGFDDDWNYVGEQRKATFTNLPAGSYTFRVKASADGIHWDASPSSVEVEVKPVFYRTTIANIIYAVLVVLIVLGFRKWEIHEAEKKNQIRLERLRNKKEQEFYNQKIEFFTAMAHEIRTPLSLIIAPLEKLLSRKKWAPDERTQLKVMEDNSGRLLNLVNQLLDFRRIESDIYEIKKEEVELVSLIHTIYSRFSSISYQKNIRFTMSTRINRLLVEADPEALTKVFSNLLINAFKFTHTKVKVIVDEPAVTDGDKGFFSVSVEDDGPGIPQEEITQIFKKFIKVSSGNGQYDNLGGTGIGLALAKSLTEKHGGQLEVSSIPHEKTVFKVLIPYAGSGRSTDVQTAIPVESHAMRQGAVILVVEDDIGMNDFIVNSLRTEGYDVLTAFNGREAMELIESQSVDLVLSDVMMPETDGLTLCKQIKEDTNYCHLPVMLLTAKGNSDAEIAGIENGADAYIVKPFKLKYVLARVRNLLESRARLRRKFALHPVVDGESLTTNSRDKQFIEKVTGIIEERMRDPQLSVEELSSAMAMSRSNLHKKLKALSGYVPNEFIRLIRLKHAAKLMVNNQYNISEIVYLVGFNSHSYFSKCFAQQFQMTPKEFMEKQTTQNYYNPPQSC